MKVGLLVPAPSDSESFRRDRERYIPRRSGCYALTTFELDVLYVGLSTNLRVRFSQHLDSSAKVSLTPMGRAVLFHWLERTDLNRVERSWLAIHVQEEGVRPILNKMDSPVDT